MIFVEPANTVDRKGQAGLEINTKFDIIKNLDGQWKPLRLLIAALCEYIHE